MNTLVGTRFTNTMKTLSKKERILKSYGKKAQKILSRIFNTESPNQKAWVVFSPQADRAWLRFLRKGYRHCFIVMTDGNGWLSVDPMLHRTEIKQHRHLPDGFDFPAWLAKRGYDVIQAPVKYPSTKRFPVFRPLTCVETIKRILGITKRGVLTPWQLKKFLKKTAYIHYDIPEFMSMRMPVLDTASYSANPSYAAILQSDNIAVSQYKTVH